jgi:hypothetical protein
MPAHNQIEPPPPKVDIEERRRMHCYSVCTLRVTRETYIRFYALDDKTGPLSGRKKLAAAGTHFEHAHSWLQYRE